LVNSLKFILHITVVTYLLTSKGGVAVSNRSKT